MDLFLIQRAPYCVCNEEIHYSEIPLIFLGAMVTHKAVTLKNFDTDKEHDLSLIFSLR
jgi:hypothetical protein